MLFFNSTLTERNSKWEMYEQNNYSHFKQLHEKKLMERKIKKFFLKKGLIYKMET